MREVFTPFWRLGVVGRILRKTSVTFTSSLLKVGGAFKYDLIWQKGAYRGEPQLIP